MAIKVSNGKQTFEVDDSNIEAAKADGFVPTVKVSNGKLEHDVHPENLQAAANDGFKPLDTRSARQLVGEALDVTNWPRNALAGLEKLDEYTGAPVRKFVTEKLSGKEVDKAPTGAEQAKMLGATDVSYGEMLGVPERYRNMTLTNVSPADIYGVGLEVLQDPTMIAGAAYKGARNLLKGGAAAAENMIGRTTSKAAQSASASASAEAGARASAVIKDGNITVEQGGKLFEVKAPKSLDELRDWKPSGESTGLPARSRLQQIESNVTDLQTKPLKYHYDMLENPKSMKQMKLEFENLPTDDAKQIASYNQEMYNEASNKLQATVNDIAKGDVKDLPDSGIDFIEAVKGKYSEEKKALAPLFQEINQRAGVVSPQESQDLIIALGENSKIGKLIEQQEQTGKLVLGRNTPKSGISDAEHGVLSRVVDALNEGASFKEIQDIRDFMRKSMDPMNPGATSEIGKVRSVLLDQLQHISSSRGPDVGDTFKRYAVNERSRENLEKIIGGKISSLDAMYAANPDRVVKKIFANPNHTKVVAEYVGQETMDKMIAAHIQQGLRAATDSTNGFKPHDFKRWLKTNEAFLKNNVSPDVAERLNDLADYGYMAKRFLDEVNPSGSAASILAGIEPKGFMQRVSKEGPIAALRAETVGRVDSKLRQRQAIKSIDERMGKPQQEGFASRIRGKVPDNFDGAISDAQGISRAAATARGIVQDGSTQVADDRPKKGPEKWVLDGIDNLYQAGIPMEQLEALKASPKGRDLLMEAQGASPNSTRLKAVMQRIRTASEGGQ